MNVSISDCPSCSTEFESSEKTLHILIIEGDTITSEYSTKGLTQAGHDVHTIQEAKDGLTHCLNKKYDLLMVSGVDGLSYIKAARAAGVNTPALFLGAPSNANDRVSVLAAGADDYLSKPFAFSELLARVDSLGRQPAAPHETTRLSVGDLSMDLLKKTVKRGDIVFDLQPREFRLLEVLMRNDGGVVSRAMLLEKVWDFYFDPQSRVVETHINRLRSKIDIPFDVELLHTSGNMGYCLHAPRT